MASNKSSIIEAISGLLTVNGFKVESSGEGPDIIGVLDLGFTSLRIGIVIQGDSSLFESLGRAVAYKSDFNLDKVVVITGEDVRRPRAIGGVEVVGASSIKPLLAEAVKRGVEDLRVIRDVRKFYVEPSLEADDVRNLALRHRGFFTRKGDFIGARVMFLPLYCFKVMVHSIDYVLEPLEAEVSVLCFDLVTGSLVSYDDGIKISSQLVRIGELSGDVLAVLAKIAELGEASIAELSSELRDLDVDRAVDVLLERGLIEDKGGEVYSLAPLRLGNYRAPAFMDGAKEGKPLCGTVIDVHVRPDNLEKVISLYGAVKEKFVFYYPLYLIVYTKRKTAKTIEIGIVIDGITGKRRGEIEEEISESPAVLEIDSLIDDVLERGYIETCTQTRIRTGSTES